jgi:hypothetical protein
MAVYVAPIGVTQASCADCTRPRLIADEVVASEARGGAAVTFRRRLTVLEGCSRCEGSTVLL